MKADIVGRLRAIEVAAQAYADDHGERFAATLRKLLERTK